MGAQSLDASSRLYNLVCPSISQLVRQSVGWSVCWLVGWCRFCQKQGKLILKTNHVITSIIPQGDAKVKNQQFLIISKPEQKVKNRTLSPG